MKPIQLLSTFWNLSLLFSPWFVGMSHARNTCTFSGQVFQRDEPLGDMFVTRCGSADEFPCYCDPDSNPPISCPYCGIANDQDGVTCARVDGPTVSLTNIDGEQVDCTCHEDSDGNPETDCQPAGSGDTTCTIEWEDGSVDVFQDGESYGEIIFADRCGLPHEWPCFCNVDMPNKIECPYCGVATNTGDLACAPIGDTIVVVNQQSETVSCTCDTNQQMQCSPAGNDTPTDSPTKSPTESPNSPPTPSDDVCTIEWDDGTKDVYQNGESYGEVIFAKQCGAPHEWPCYCNVDMPQKTECPYCEVTTNTGDTACARVGETIVITDVDDQEVSCSCRQSLQTQCTPTADLVPTGSPTAIPTQIPTPAPSLRPGTTASPTLNPTLPPFFILPTLSPTDSPTPSPSLLNPTEPSTPFPTIQLFDKPSIVAPIRIPPEMTSPPGCYFDHNGQERFAHPEQDISTDVLQGPCGPVEEFPFLCNPELLGSVEYPYCVFSPDGVSTAPEDIVCAKPGESVVVPGTALPCLCTYFGPILGPTSSCRLLVDVTTGKYTLTESPTSVPTEAPTATPETSQPTPDDSSSPKAMVGLWLIVSIVMVLFVPEF